MSNLTLMRQSLADSLADFGRVVYAYPKEAIALPAIVIVPGTPYIEPDKTFGGRYQVNLDVTVCVAVPDNQTALANLEALMLAVTGSLPADVNMLQWSTPNITEVGPQNALTSVLTVQAFASL